MSWNEEEMIREMPIVNLKLDEAVEILVQLKAFNISLYKEILEIKPETKDVEGFIGRSKELSRYYYAFGWNCAKHFYEDDVQIGW